VALVKEEKWGWQGAVREKKKRKKKEGTTSGSPSPLLALKNQNHAIHKLNS